MAQCLAVMQAALHASPRSLTTAPVSSRLFRRALGIVARASLDGARAGPGAQANALLPESSLRLQLAATEDVVSDLRRLQHSPELQASLCRLQLRTHFATAACTLELQAPRVLITGMLPAAQALWHQLAVSNSQIVFMNAAALRLRERLMLPLRVVHQNIQFEVNRSDPAGQSPLPVSLVLHVASTVPSSAWLPRPAPIVQATLTGAQDSHIPCLSVACAEDKPQLVFWRDDAHGPPLHIEGLVAHIINTLNSSMIMSRL